MSRAGAVSNPSLLTVPLQRASDTFPQSDLRLEPELASRAADVERAALPEEVYTPAVERRRDPEGSTYEFAGACGEPDRPHRNSTRRGRDSRDVRRDLHQLRQRRQLPAREDVGPSGRRRRRRAQSESRTEIVDIGDVVKMPSAAEHQ